MGGGLIRRTEVGRGYRAALGVHARVAVGSRWDPSSLGESWRRAFYPALGPGMKRRIKPQG
jgi:hypothetical protein